MIWFEKVRSVPGRDPRHTGKALSRGEPGGEGARDSWF